VLVAKDSIGSNSANKTLNPQRFLLWRRGGKAWPQRSEHGCASNDSSVRRNVLARRAFIGSNTVGEDRFTLFGIALGAWHFLAVIVMEPMLSLARPNFASCPPSWIRRRSRGWFDQTSLVSTPQNSQPS